MQATGERHLCLAGGVALNCVLNARLRDAGPFDDIWVQPAAGDAGTALGAALVTDARSGSAPSRHRWKTRSSDRRLTMPKLKRAPLTQNSRTADGRIAGRDARDCWTKTSILGWFQGAMEFGPRALGARSILASPRDPLMQERLNAIKDREDFRPVAPVVLEERAAEWFAPAHVSPFMLFTAPCASERASQIRGRAPCGRHRTCTDGQSRGSPLFAHPSQRIRSARRRARPHQHILQHAR